MRIWRLQILQYITGIAELNTDHEFRCMWM